MGGGGARWGAAPKASNSKRLTERSKPRGAGPPRQRHAAGPHRAAAGSVRGWGPIGLRRRCRARACGTSECKRGQGAGPAGRARLALVGGPQYVQFLRALRGGKARRPRMAGLGERRAVRHRHMTRRRAPRRGPRWAKARSEARPGLGRPPMVEDACNERAAAPAGGRQRERHRGERRCCCAVWWLWTARSTLREKGSRVVLRALGVGLGLVVKYEWNKKHARGGRA
jgi:hypothetical protein